MLDLTASPEFVAPLLLGAVLRRNDSADGADGADGASNAVAVQITEVEAYPGVGDAASHTAKGWTPRCATMFGPPGHLYVYASYGIHRAGNIVCRPDGIGAGVLLRAGRVVEGMDVARARRTQVRTRTSESGVEELSTVVPADEALASGPGNLGAALGLDLDLDGATLEVIGAGGSDAGDDSAGESGAGYGAFSGAPSPLSPNSPTTATFSLFPAAEPVECVRGKRIGISKNVDAPLRFWIPGDRTVTSPRSCRSGAPLQLPHRDYPGQ